MTKKVLVPVAQGTEEMEAITIIDVLRRAGAEVTVASVDDLEIHAARGIVFKADCLIGDCMAENWDLIALPGGIPGAENLKIQKIWPGCWNVRPGRTGITVPSVRLLPWSFIPRGW